MTTVEQNKTFIHIDQYSTPVAEYISSVEINASFL